MDLFPVFLLGVCASAFDLRLKRIPDWLNAFFFLYAAHSSTALGVLPSFALFFAFSLLFSKKLHELGVWGGGDAKLFITLSCFLPLAGKPLESSVLLFVVSAFALGAFWMLLGAISILKHGGVKNSEARRFAFAPFLAAAFAIVVFFQ